MTGERAKDTEEKGKYEKKGAEISLRGG